MTAHAKFRRWIRALEKAGATRTSIANRLLCGPSTITKLMDDPRRGVSLRLAFAIERETQDWRDGPILAAEWAADSEAAA